MLKGAIFDLDGVVVDTIPLHFEAWKRMFAEYGADFTFEEYKSKVDGIPRTDGAKAILTNLSDEKIIEASDRKQGYFVEYIKKKKIQTFESTITLIDELLNEGIKVAVISSSKNCIAILKRIKLYNKLHAVVDAMQVSKGKPDPEIFFTAAKRIDVDCNDIIVFEDAALGVKAAKLAGMFCVGIDRYHDPGRLSKADLVVPDLKEINIQRLRNIF
jgi:beta-phosphoglucomutase